MRPVVLHIGSPKTGTTSLQQYLNRNVANFREQGVVYPVAGRRAAGQIAHHNLCYEVQPKRVEAGKFVTALGSWSEALAEIDEFGTRLGVISSEAFMNQKANQVHSLAKILTGRHVSVVAYVRRQDRWFQSAWNQQARFGRCGLDFWEFYKHTHSRGRGNYFRMLKPWVELFGRENIHVRNFDSLPSGGIVADFMRTFLPDLDVKFAGQGSLTNSKAGIKQLVSVAMVLEICREHMGPTFNLPSGSAIRIGEFFRASDTEVRKYSVLSFRDAKQIISDFKESNYQLSMLAADFFESGGFPDPIPSEFDDYVDLSTLGEDVLLKNELRFVHRMAREVTRFSRMGR